MDTLADEGFTGISVALLGICHPIGILFAGIFIACLTAGGFYLQLFEFSTEIIDIIVAVIIYFSAFSLIVKNFISKRQQMRELNKLEGVNDPLPDKAIEAPPNMEKSEQVDSNSEKGGN